MPFGSGITQRGWGVFRRQKWHFVGLYLDREEALAKAREMGADYEVKFGDNRVGSDDFAWSPNENPGDA